MIPRSSLTDCLWLQLSKTDLRFEAVQKNAYEMFLLISFIVLVPGAFVVAIAFKVRFMNTAVKAFDEESEDLLHKRRRAFDLHVVGLGSAEEKKELQRYIDGWAIHREHACFLSHCKSAAP